MEEFFAVEGSQGLSQNHDCPNEKDIWNVKRDCYGIVIVIVNNVTNSSQYVQAG